jgi:uncharacterized membrane protein
MLISARTGGALARADRRARVPWIDKEMWALSVVTIVGAALRFATLADQSFWLDEAQAAHEMHLSFGAMLTAWSHTEGNPPLYFVLVWPWAHVFGTGEAGMRSFSALVGTALIPITYLCGRELVSRRAGVAAAALAALNPFMIWYSQEAREYILLATLTAGTIVFFARAVREPSRRALGGWVVLSALALATQYFAGFIVAAEAAILLYRAPKRTFVAACVLAAVEAAVVPHGLSFVSRPLPWIVGNPLMVRIRQVPVAFAMNTLYQTPIVTYGLLGAAALVAVLIGLLVTFARPPQLRGAGLAAALAAAVLLAPLVLALSGHDEYIARALIPAWVPLAVVVGAACTVPRAWAAGAVLFLALSVTFVWATIRIDGRPNLQRPDWRGVAAALGRSRGERAIVAYDGVLESGPLSVYLPNVSWAGPGQTPLPAGPVAVSELDIVGPGVPVGRLPAGFRPIVATTVHGYHITRLHLPVGWHATPPMIVSRATTLLGLPSADAAVILQPRSA